jgi:formylglycine-generating enzyme required for sulfatase activity
MIRIAGGEFRMGSADFYPEERPVRRVRVDGFWIDPCPVTVDEFGGFVAATGYVTLAERAPDPADYPEADPSALEPGSAVFRPTEGPVNLGSLAWWHYVPGASWRRPEGPGSGVSGRGDHPVTHVAYEDALAFAAWAGKSLPSETEWEHAARGGLDGARFAWGDDELPGGQWLANVWQGEFPWQNLALDGYPGTSPVGAFPPNGHGLYDMTGNVWEWTTSLFSHANGRSCCTPPAAQGTIPSRVIKGGSHLCAPSYCLRYRPAARQPQTVDTSTSHVGFRCVRRE